MFIFTRRSFMSLLMFIVIVHESKKNEVYIYLMNMRAVEYRTI